MPKSASPSRVVRRWRYFYGAHVPELINARQLASAIEKRYGAPANGTSRERRLRDLSSPTGGLPGPEIAWEIGQCLSRRLAWSSGPVSLWAAGCYPAFIGYFSTLWDALSRQSDYDGHLQLLLMLNGLPRLFKGALRDEQIDFRDMLSGLSAKVVEDRDDAWRTLRSNVDFDRLRTYNIDAIRATWSLSDEALAQADSLWHRWLLSRRLLRKTHIAIRAAASVAKDGNFSLGEREGIILYCLHAAFDSLRDKEIGFKG